MDDAQHALKRALIEATMLWDFESESERAKRQVEGEG